MLVHFLISIFLFTLHKFRVVRDLIQIFYPNIVFRQGNGEQREKIGCCFKNAYEHLKNFIPVQLLQLTKDRIMWGSQDAEIGYLDKVKQI